MRAAWVVAALAVIGCEHAETPTEREIPATLRERLASNPYTYFRFINRKFAQRVCEELRARVDMTPTVNLHGDAHLEQYAVMADSRGLMDFDDSSRGPAMLDLARFGASVVIAAELNGWSSETPLLLETLWRGYRDALVNPGREPPPPRAVTRIRDEFESDRNSFLERAETLMRPRSMTPAEADPTLRFGVSLLTEALEERYPDNRPGFFAVKRVGALETGIGSALTPKYLLRVEGATDASDDDLVLEAKLLLELTDVDCIERGRSDPFPILVAQSQIANQPYEYVGYFYLDPSRAETSALGVDYWDGSIYMVYSWLDHYVELSVADSFASVDELSEVVYDAGIKLGHGHTGGLTGPTGAFREQLVRMAEARYQDYLDIVTTLSGEVLAEWRRLASSP